MSRSTFLPSLAGIASMSCPGPPWPAPWPTSSAAVPSASPGAPTRTQSRPKYPGGTWDKDDNGADRYCASSRQALLKLPAQHQTKELCFIMGFDKTMGAVSARLDPSLPSLLAVVNRSRTMFGDFDAVKRDDAAIQSKYTYMLWLRDAPIIAVVSSANGDDGKPNMVAFSVADEASLFAKDADKVSNKPR